MEAVRDRFWVRYPRSGLVETWHGTVGPEDVAWLWSQVAQATMASLLKEAVLRGLASGLDEAIQELR